MPFRNRLLTCLALVSLALSIPGCTERDAREGLPNLLRISVLPDANRPGLFERYEPLRAYLSETLDVRSVLLVPETYAALVADFGAGDVDLAYFGGLTFVQAHTAHRAVPLVMRDVDARFTSYFITHADAPTGDLEVFENGTFAFGSRLSTSGHLMPRHFLLDRGLQPESFFAEVRYSGDHDRSIDWVRDGTVSLAAVNSSLFRARTESGDIDPDALRVVWETPPYINYVWAVPHALGAPARQRLRDAFLALTPADDTHREILQGLDAGGFLPVDAEAFSPLAEIASRLGLLQ